MFWSSSYRSGATASRRGAVAESKDPYQFNLTNAGNSLGSQDNEFTATAYQRTNDCSVLDVTVVLSAEKIYMHVCICQQQSYNLLDESSAHRPTPLAPARRRCQAAQQTSGAYRRNSAWPAQIRAPDFCP